MALFLGSLFYSTGSCVFMPLSHCFNYLGFIMCFVAVGNRQVSIRVLKIVFSILGLLLFHMNLGSVFKFHKKLFWDFGRTYIELIDKENWDLSIWNHPIQEQGHSLFGSVLFLHSGFCFFFKYLWIKFFYKNLPHHFGGFISFIYAHIFLLWKFQIHSKV